MATADKVLAKLKGLNIPLLEQIAIENTATAATDAQKNQLSQGLRRDDMLMPSYSERSVRVYGKPPGPIKLYDQGDFYKGIFIDVRGPKFAIESSDIKNTMLQDRYGKDILGLGTDAKTEYIQTLQPEFIKLVKKDLS